MELADIRPAAAEAGQSYDRAVLGPVPPRYTVGVHKVICDYIREGNRPVTAAQMAGIPSGVFYQWMRLGKEGNPHVAQFAEDGEIAGGQAEGTAVKVVTSAFSEDADHAKWYLERTRPEGYSKEVNAKVHALLNDFIDRLQAGLEPDVFDKVLACASGAGLPEAQPGKFQLISNDAES